MIARFLVLLVVVTAPPLAMVVATTTSTHLEAVAAEQAAARHSARAVVVGVPAQQNQPDAGSASAETWLPVRWTAPDGSSRQGRALVPIDSRSGSAVAVWLDRSGNLTGAPMDRNSISGATVAVSGLTLIGVPVAAWALYGLLILGLDARRNRRWAHGWAAVEPEWRSSLR
jgi:hypothetical protein